MRELLRQLLGRVLSPKRGLALRYGSVGSKMMTLGNVKMGIVEGQAAFLMLPLVAMLWVKLHSNWRNRYPTPRTLSNQGDRTLVNIHVVLLFLLSSLAIRKIFVFCLAIAHFYQE